MRTGTWLLMAGLDLLALGIVTAPKVEREARDRSLTIPMQGVDALDLESSGLDTIMLDAVPELTLNYQLWHRHHDIEEPLISSHATNGVLTLETNQGYWHNATLTAPLSLKRVHGNDLSVSALQPAGTLRLEGSSVRWNKGTADMLDVHLHTSPRGCTQSSSTSPAFTFEHGKINLLRIHAHTGTVIFEYIDQVGDIELHAGPSVRVQARHTDLPRIRIVPLDIRDTPLTPPPSPCSAGSTVESDSDP